MPLNLAQFNIKYKISKAGSEIELLSEIHGYYIVMVKGSKIGIEKSMAKRIILYAA